MELTANTNRLSRKYINYVLLVKSILEVNRNKYEVDKKLVIWNEVV